MAVINVIGELRQMGTLSNPVGDPVADGEGGFTQEYAECDPPDWRFAIEKATVRSAERHFLGTTTGHATHIVTGRFHPDIGLQTRLVWTDRNGDVHTANVIDVDDTEGAGIVSIAAITEIAT